MGYDLDRLGDYFDADSVEWRLQNAKSGAQQGLAVPYVTNRAIMDRLDAVVGPMNWKNEFRPWHRFNTKDGEVVGQLCGIYIYDPDRQEWVDKWDGAQLSAIEPLKGGLSDAMKRSAVQWNIGRYLYRMDAVWVDIEAAGKSQKMRMTKGAIASLPGIYMGMLEKLKANIPIPIPNRIALGMDDPSPQWEPDGGAPDVQGQQPHPQAPPQQGSKTKPVPAEKGTRQAAAQTQEGAAVYIVVERSAKLVANNTHIKLQTPDGEVRNAFLRGECPGVTKGTRLVNVKMTPQREGSYAYFSVDGFELAA